MLLHYVKPAVRYVRKHWSTSMINIAGLSLSITVATLISVWVSNESSYDNYQPGAGKIYLLKNYWQIDKNPVWIEENSFYPLADAITQSVPEVEAVTQMEKIMAGDLTLNVHHNLFKEDSGIRVDKNWFTLFHFNFLSGNAASLYERPNSVILTETKAKQLFGNTDCLYQQIRVDTITYTVTGILQNNPLNSNFQFDVIFPFGDKQDMENWLYLWNRMFVKLKSSAQESTAVQKINNIIKKNSKAEGEIKATLLPLLKMHSDTGFAYSAFKHVDAKLIYFFAVLAACLLIVAALNYINLTLAAASKRIKELAIRKITGASRMQLFFQVMTDSLVIILFSMLLSLALLYPGFQLLQKFTGQAFAFHPLEKRTFLPLICIPFMLLLLAGIYPAIKLSAFKPEAFFSGRKFSGFANIKIEKFIFFIQFAFSMFMVIAVITIYRQLDFIQNQATTFNRKQVFMLKIPPIKFTEKENREEKNQEYILSSLKNELLHAAGVEHVSRTDISSLENENSTTSNGIDWEGKPESFEPDYISYSIDADLDKIVHFQLVKGRWFSENDLSDKENVILNETAIKQFGLQEPILGKRFNKGIIIGIAKDFFHQDLHSKIGPLVIRTGKPRVSNFIIQARPGMTGIALEESKKIWKSRFPSAIFDYRFDEDEFTSLYAGDRKLLSLNSIISGISIFLSCMGLLAMTIFLTEKRTKEIGIRKVLGATDLDIVVLLMGNFLLPVCFAFLVAASLGWWTMHKWLENYAYRIPFNSGICLLAGLVSVGIAALTIGFRVIRSAGANPADAIRAE